MPSDFRLALIAVVVGLAACREERPAHTPAAAAVTHSDTVLLARRFAEALARADAEGMPVREKVQSNATELRARSGQGPWQATVLRELHTLRPQLFEPTPTGKPTVWLAINPLDLRGDTAVAWAGWYLCPGDGNAFSQYYRFVIDRATGNWESLPPARGAIGNIICGVPDTAASRDAGRTVSQPPAA